MAGFGEAVARAEQHLLDPERLRELAELEEAIARTRRRLDELHRRYLEIVRGVLAEHAGARVRVGGPPRGGTDRRASRANGRPTRPVTRVHAAAATAAACLLLLAIGSAALGAEPNVTSLLAGGVAAILYGSVAWLVTGVATGAVGAGVCLVLVAAAHAALGAEPTPARLAVVGLGGLVCALAVSRRERGGG